MTMPFYASAEQIMRDRSEFARKNVARGRGVIALKVSEGVLLVAENQSGTTLHKVSEIYDRIGFAAAGRYNEYENLRVAGVRYAELIGYSNSRRDVSARAIANAYAQTLGSIFTQEQKPYEVEICVAEVGSRAEDDQLYRNTYDGSITDEQDFAVMGGQSDAIAETLRQSYRPGMEIGEAIRAAVHALASSGADQPRELASAQLEVALLDRSRAKRAFRRLNGTALEAMLETPAAEAAKADPAAEAAEADPAEAPELGPEETPDSDA
jgi:proteasome alpha subunit